MKMSVLYSSVVRNVPRILFQFRPYAAINHLCESSSSLTYVAQLKQPARTISISAPMLQEDKSVEGDKEEINPYILRHPERDRRTVIPVETSIRYLKSKAFKEAYGDHPVWFLFRRNFKGWIPPTKTRKLCIRADVVSTGSPCPICRDEYLIVDYRNVDLLKQFISPNTGKILSYQKTGVCQKQHKKLLIAYERAQDLGLITFDVPFRQYNYSEFKSE